MTDDQKKEKLRKLKELAERGVGGERENAGAFFEKMLLKWGIDPNDLGSDDEAVKSEVFFVFNMDEFIVLSFVLSYVTEGRVKPNRRGGDDGLYVYADLSRFENAQVRAFWVLAYDAWARTLDKVESKRKKERDELKLIKQYHRKKLKELDVKTKEMYKNQKAERSNTVTAFILKNGLHQFMKRDSGRKSRPSSKTDQQGLISALANVEEIDETQRFGAQSLPFHD